METGTRQEFRARRLRERRQRVIVLGLLLGAGILAYWLTLTAGDQDTEPEAQIREGLRLAAPLQQAVADYVRSEQTYPADNSDVGLAASHTFGGDYIESVAIDRGFIAIAFRSDAHPRLRNKQVILIPDVRSNGSLVWGCDARDVDSRYLPAQCERARQRLR